MLRNDVRPGASAREGSRSRVELSPCPWVPSPEPRRDDTKIRWSIPRELTGERFQLALFDVGGRKVTTVAEGNAEAGLFARQLQSQGEASLTSGVYFLRLQIGGKQLTRSLIVAR